MLIVPLLERGFDVWTYDLTGQGGSSRILDAGKHGSHTVQYLQHIDSFDIYLQDMNSFLSEIVVPHTQGEIILGGYSTGGHLALRYAQRYPENPFKAIFVISPLLTLKTPLPNVVFSYFLWGASWLIDLERYVPGTSDEDPVYHMYFLENPYTSDESSFNEIVDLCKQYPHLMMGGASLGWVNATLQSINELWQKKAMNKITIPVLIATGGGGRNC